MLSRKQIEEKIKKLEEENKVLPATSDEVFKGLFQDPDMLDVIAFIITNVTDIKEAYVLKHLHYDNTELPKNHILEKSKTTDLALKIGNHSLQWEMNGSNNSNNEYSNNAHFFGEIVKSIRINDKKAKINVYQINFDNEKGFTDNLISEIIFMDRKTGKVDNENYKKYRINLVKLKNKYYNGCRLLFTAKDK